MSGAALLREIATGFCLLFFLGVLAWVLLARRARYDRAARLPLDDPSPAPGSSPRQAESRDV
ncbi:MAG: CcoQ/FixQ family Cbb3-type cytochrome c oxidase assembly chaperone [Planctomycetota bacterium]|nr:MAG: CcoQ/FixQ family Cbb3-type cytochrome c oxidase assembly chaperone [Planctomycetota bacterium]